MNTCDKCNTGKFIPRYRKNKPPKFYCSNCGRCNKEQRLKNA